MKQITTYPELKAEVEANDGVLTVDMLTLRQIHGAERLGINVRYNIHQQLAGNGLAHYPRTLPDSQHAYARIYKQGSRAAEIIGAVLEPDPDKDAIIRKAGDETHQDVLRKIRELVED